MTRLLSEKSGLAARHRKLSRPTGVRWVWWATLMACFALPVLAIEHRYDLRFSESLDEVAVTARLAGDVRRLSARNGDVGRLLNLRDCDGSEVSRRGNRIRLSADVSCVSYRHRLAADDSRVPLDEGVVVTSPSTWLYLPRLADTDTVVITTDLPAGARLSTPWQPLGAHRHRLSASPQSSRANLILGQFDLTDLEVPGGSLRVALVEGRVQGLDRDKVLTWLRAAAGDVAGVYGRFPNPHAQVIVISASGSRSARSAVPFGHVIRDGGEAVRFFVNDSKPLDSFLGDWTASHEFAHLLLPYIRSEQKWISEGFASYYQNVLLARRGVYTEQEAWGRLHRSFTRARQIDDPPSPNESASRPFWEMRMLIYWSGAAVALLADAELRELSNGRESLDTVLGRLQSCCLPTTHTWTGAEFFAKLDELATHKIFTRLYETHGNARGMPDMGTLYDRLGISLDGEGLKLLEEAELVHIRSAIMAATKPPAGAG